VVVKATNSERIKFKLIYISEEIIDCKFEEKFQDIKEHKQLNIGDTLVSIVCNPDDLLTDSGVIGFSFRFGVSFQMSSHMKCNLVSRKFIDQTSFDFTIECQNEKFRVHQMVLRDQSEYFEAVLGSDCKESREKRVIINDFEAKVVEVLLKYIYNGAVHYDNLDVTDTSLMKIADKYNFTSLYDAIDSQLAQVLSSIKNLSCSNTKKVKMLKKFIQFCEETGAPKLSAMIFFLKSSVNGACGLSDNQWSTLIWKNSNFALVAANTAGREDYQLWLKQHRFWKLSADCFKEKNDFALIVGPLGMMKGATNCLHF
jgi:hypothetical protein